MENKKIADIIIKQIHLFFISGLYGILLGLWYEFFRTLRKNFVHKNKMVPIPMSKEIWMTPSLFRCIIREWYDFIVWLD